MQAEAAFQRWLKEFVERRRYVLTYEADLRAAFMAGTKEAKDGNESK